MQPKTSRNQPKSGLSPEEVGIDPMFFETFAQNVNVRESAKYDEKQPKSFQNRPTNHPETPPTPPNGGKYYGNMNYLSQKPPK
jgi:hypothetical protein